MASEEKIICLVAAAGRGVRLGREIPKSFYPVEGRTLLAMSIENLLKWGGISVFVVIVPPGWEEKAEELLSKEVPDAVVRVVAGGSTRQESVAIGLKEADGAELILIHDACRPFVSPSLVERVVAEARVSGAAVPVLQTTDTLGRLRGKELESMVPRDRVVGIQTPQGFRAEVLKKAYHNDEDLIRTATDESSLVLLADMPVKAVEGERWNIKVTVREDLDIIKSFLAGRKLDLPETDDPE
ncbi:MAG: 2-C-methyl-D-erythritol 4-phosphate cytidylyltransferase [Candidatus Krumholzibacteriota bacterium]|nr:2-C-methyl-D-erythritol 4-phosphate cytidylyltransferase [Candidatus Krumholzibacteriota bacterium]